VLGDTPAEAGAVITVNSREHGQLGLQWTPVDGRSCNARLQDNMRAAVSQSAHVHLRSRNAHQSSRSGEFFPVNARADQLQGHLHRKENHNREYQPPKQEAQHLSEDYILIIRVLRLYSASDIARQTTAVEPPSLDHPARSSAVPEEEEA
jgi:hypothetical protein